MSETEWPSFERAPAVAFVDVDGTLLAETTTFLFARILLRRGLIRRSFLLRALYHGLQHRLGRLDYGRLLAYGLKNIARIPVVELERIAYENFTEHVRPRLYDGVVDHFNKLRRGGTPIVLVSSSPGLVIEPLSLYLGCTATLTTPVVIERNRMIGWVPGRHVMAKASFIGPNDGPESMDCPCSRRWVMPITGVIEPCCSALATRSWSTPKAGCFVWRSTGDGT